MHVSINRLNYFLNCRGEAVLEQTATPLQELNGLKGTYAGEINSWV
jgi:hypothetical protein